MTPDHATTTLEPGDLRAELKPDGPVGGYVDGAWWPRTHGLAAELPHLLAFAAERVGPVARVGFHLDGWDAGGPRKLRTSTVRVPLEGFRTTDPHLLSVMGQNDRRLILLVIPPETEDATAQRALHAAAESGNVESPEALLN